MTTATRIGDQRPAGPTAASQDARFELPATAPSLVAFEGWSSNRRTTRGKGLNTKSKAGYLLIWTAWLRHLAALQIPWDRATSRDVTAFLQSVRPSSNRHASTSTVTHRRYWSLLDDVYSHALVNGLCESNPARSLRAGDDVPSTERVDSVMIPSIRLAELREALTEHKFSDDDDPGKTTAWTSMRDRALMAVLLDAGPTTQELQALRPSHIHWSRGPVIVTLVGRGDTKRHLQLSSSAGAAVRVWMRRRAQMEPQRDHVFFSKKGGPLGKVQIYYIVRTFLRARLPGLGLADAKHQGPAMIRTSVIGEWLARGDGVDDVVARAGLSAPQCLRRIITFNATGTS